MQQLLSTRTGSRRWLGGIAAASTLALLTFASAPNGTTIAQDAEWDPTYGYHAEEWYDPSDWFDADEGVDYENDYYGSYFDDGDDRFGADPYGDTDDRFVDDYFEEETDDYEYDSVYDEPNSVYEELGEYEYDSYGSNYDANDYLEEYGRSPYVGPEMPYTETEWPAHYYTTDWYDEDSDFDAWWSGL
ncbi:hypothetical protein Mal4_21720 [Maioricimonas rarisocia]|uniref:Uncharacterized protein n=1 Tax=Maioricimonas rarisocia TaxID=2528026 RepID=A0A517Z5W7_9PLAN|nr:hypothetical protein [Maioricimonas rarisocia]QDU37855.1 hypothetical protein Mal4_21720 [Maioricimonas rarisocia]